MGHTKKSKIDREYFQNYAGRGQDYDSVYEEHSAIPECIALFKMPGAPRLKKICVLGAATGRVLEDFYKAFGVLPHGCELNPWAHSQISRRFQKRVVLQGMRPYLQNAIDSEKVFDLLFSNSLIYLPPSEAVVTIGKISQLARYVHFDSSFLGSACPDPYRKTLKSYQWWAKNFDRFGFEEVRLLRKKRTYLWKNLLLID